MSFFRSEEMRYYQMFIPKESGWEIMSELGKISMVHFVLDETNLLNRPYAKLVKRCELLLNNLELIKDDICKENFYFKNRPPVSYSEFEQIMEKISASRANSPTTYIEELETELNERINFFKEQKSNLDKLREKKREMKENIEVLNRIFEASQTSNILTKPQQFNDSNINIKVRIGVIPKELAYDFQKTLFRSTKGNILLRTFDVRISKGSKDTNLRTIFIAIYSMGSYNSIGAKFERICRIFEANIYNFDFNTMNFQEKIKEAQSKIEESKELIKLTRNRIFEIENFFTADIMEGYSFPTVIFHQMYLEKEKYIYDSLNKMGVRNNIYIVNIWAPKSQENYILGTINELTMNRADLVGAQLQEKPFPFDAKPPTYIKTNAFTEPFQVLFFLFQMIINQYGIPNYREINPAFFATITFPFLFAVMFGDLGHGLCLLLFSSFIVHNVKDGHPLYKLRYLLLVLSFFSMYCGLIYNEFFSIPANFFNSCYSIFVMNIVNKSDKSITRKDDCVYPIGIDPIWAISENRISFDNSLKMKISFILAYIHMGIGVLLKLFNLLEFKEFLEIFTNYLPQTILYFTFLGYLFELILKKWMTIFANSSEAPSIISLSINQTLGFFLGGSTTSEFDNNGKKVVIISLIMVALMLLSPLTKKVIKLLFTLIFRPSRRPMKTFDVIEMKNQLGDNDQENIRLNPIQSIEVLSDHSSAGEERHDEGEELVTALIENIEFILGLLLLMKGLYRIVHHI